jgi:hypothetical protein
MKPLDVVLAGLMSRYQSRVPDVERVLKLCVQEGLIAAENQIENDHIAFRTMGVPPLGIASFEKIFLHYGYTKKDYYYFEEKKLNAYWYAPPEEHYPRIFVSELIVEKLSERAQAVIKKYTDQVSADPVDQLDLNNGAEVDAFLHRPLWSTPTLADYEFLAGESEYAAWVIYNRYYLNHFTIAVHQLSVGYNTVMHFNQFLEKHGFKLNTAGGKIKTSPDGGLSQSSTVAGMVPAVFADGEEQLIPGSYVEFAERRVLPEFVHLPADQIKRWHRREGFESANADKIFESTYRSQTQ